MKNEILTTGQKAAATRQRNKEKRLQRERENKETVAALEEILKDKASSAAAKENALFLLTNIYKGGAAV